jgi:hypothetical protein
MDQQIAKKNNELVMLIIDCDTSKILDFNNVDLFCFEMQPKPKNM